MFLAALWSPAGEGWPLGGCLILVVFVTFSFSVLGQVWYLIGSIPDLCILSYFEKQLSLKCFGIGGSYVLGV